MAVTTMGELFRTLQAGNVTPTIPGLYGLLGLSRLLSLSELPTLPELPALPQIPEIAKSSDEPASLSDKYATEIANQLLRLAAVGATPPAAVTEREGKSVLTAIIDLLSKPGRDVRRALLGTESGAEYLSQQGVTDRTAKLVGGTLLDILTDPLSYLSLGIGAGGNIAVKAGLPFLTRYREMATIPGTAEKLTALRQVVGRTPAGRAIDWIGEKFSTGYIPISLPEEERKALRQVKDIVFSAERKMRGQRGQMFERILSGPLAEDRPLPQPIKYKTRYFPEYEIKTEGDLASFYADATHKEKFLDMINQLPGESRKRVLALSDEIRGVFSDLYNMEQSLGRDYPYLANYVYHVWKNPSWQRVQLLNELERAREKITPRGPLPIEKRKIPTLSAGLKLGLMPETNPAKLAALRTIVSTRLRAQAEIEQQLKLLAETPEGQTLIMKIPEGPLDASRMHRNLAKFSLPELEKWKEASRLSPGLAGYIVHPEVEKTFRLIDTLLTDRQQIRELLNAVEHYMGQWKQLVLVRPGYHLRNVLGNVFNITLADVPLHEIPMWVKKARDVIHVLPDDAPVELGKRVFTAGEIRQLFVDEALQGFGGFSEFTSFERELERISRAQNAGVLGKAWHKTGGVLTEASRRIGEALETNGKMALFLERLAQGLNPHEAAGVVRQFLFDYHELTPVERFIRIGVPFWTWTRRELPLLLQTVVTNPRVYIAMGSVRDELAQDLGVSQKDLPGWTRQLAGIPLYKDEMGNIRVSMPGLPTEVLGRLGPTPVDVLREIGAMLTPFVRVPMELAANTQFFAGAPIEARQYETQQVIEGVGPELPAKLVYMLRQVPVPLFGDPIRGMAAVSALGGSEATAPGEEPLSPRPVLSPIAQLTRALGLGTFAYPINPERQRQIYQILYAKQLQDYIAHLRRDLGQHVPTIRELQQR